MRIKEGAIETRTDKLNLTNVWDNVITANNQSFAYSNANRLNGTAGPWGTSSTTYDGVGNRTSEVSTPIGGSATTRTYAYSPTSNLLANVMAGTSCRRRALEMTERTFVHDVLAEPSTPKCRQPRIASGHCVTGSGAGITLDTRSGTAYGYTYNLRNRLYQVRVGGSLKGTYRYNGLEQLTYRSLTNMPVPAQAGNAERPVPVAADTRNSRVSRWAGPRKGVGLALAPAAIAP